MAASKTKLNFQPLLGAAAGGALARVADQQITEVDTRIKGAIITGAGAALSILVKNDMVRNAGLGMIGYGAAGLVGDLLQNIPVLPVNSSRLYGVEMADEYPILKGQMVVQGGRLVSVK